MGCGTMRVTYSLAASCLCPPSWCCDISHDGDLIACAASRQVGLRFLEHPDEADLVQIIHKSAPASNGPPPGQVGSQETKLQKQLAEKQQARSGKQKMFKIEEA